MAGRISRRPAAEETARSPAVMTHRHGLRASQSHTEAAFGGPSRQPARHAPPRPPATAGGTHRGNRHVAATRPRPRPRTPRRGNSSRRPVRPFGRTGGTGPGRVGPPGLAALRSHQPDGAGTAGSDRTGPMGRRNDKRPPLGDLPSVRFNRSGSESLRLTILALWRAVDHGAIQRRQVIDRQPVALCGARQAQSDPVRVAARERHHEHLDRSPW